MLYIEDISLGRVGILPLQPENEHEGDGIVIVLGDLATMATREQGPLIRMHSSCAYGHILGAITCDCLPQLKGAKAALAQEGEGLLFDLKQEGRGAGLAAKARGYELSETLGVDTFRAYELQGLPHDSRQYGHCARFMLRHGIQIARHLGNSPRKPEGLRAAGMNIVQIPLFKGANEYNRDYLIAKRAVTGHLFPEDI